jgi:hypothetical protein
MANSHVALVKDGQRVILELQHILDMLYSDDPSMLPRRSLGARFAKGHQS